MELQGHPAGRAGVRWREDLSALLYSYILPLPRSRRVSALGFQAIAKGVGLYVIVHPLQEPRLKSCLLSPLPLLNQSAKKSPNPPSLILAK